MIIELTGLARGKPAGRTLAPTLGCEGVLVIEAQRDDVLLLVGSTQKGKWICEDAAVSSRFVLTSPGTARVEYFLKNGERPFGVAELRREGR